MVDKHPPISPPKCAFQSIPGMRKGIARFNVINPAPSFRFAPNRLPITSRQPKSPKIIPDEPTAMLVSGLKR